jgi:phospholipase/carboxylesterase
MTSDAVDQVERLTTALLRTLDAVEFIGRHLNPIGYSHLLARVGAPESELRLARALPAWSDPYAALRPLLDEASDFALAAMDGLHAAAAPPEDLTAAYRALRRLPQALETLYPLAGIVPSVNRFFLEPDARADAALQARLFKQPPPAQTGVICLGDDPDARGAVWVYVPETYSHLTPSPLVVALHGGSGRGRSFLWSWVRAARTKGAILVAPTSHGQTWAIQGDDHDTPHLMGVVNFVTRTWRIDASRILLTGMSDGGTFTWTSGLEAGSPFTHLAPVAAAFHPMLAQTASSERLRDLPIHILHGAKDWMFPVDMAQDADRYFTAAGAAVTYREIADLAHAYGSDLSAVILDWLLA